MKLSQYSLLFAIIFIILITITNVRTNNYKAIIEDRQRIDKNIETAIDDGIDSLIEVDSNNNLQINKDAAVDSLFMSLYSTFDVLSDKSAQAKLDLYIPVVAVTSENGFHILYSDIYTAEDGKTYTTKRWSEKMPYYMEDDDFIYVFTLGDIITIHEKKALLDPKGDQKTHRVNYKELSTDPEYQNFRIKKSDSFLLDDELFDEVRKGVVAKCLEEKMALYTSHHNEIAVRYGLTYNFALPLVSDDAWSPYLSEPSMFVVFQGYPYGGGTGEVYNRFFSVGSRISKNKVYYIEQVGWYLMYHLNTCSELLKDGKTPADTTNTFYYDEDIYKDGIVYYNEERVPYYTEEACVQEGAYACPKCITNGVYPPDYEP